MQKKKKTIVGKMNGSMEFRQKEFRHLNFGNVQIVVEFRNMSKFYYNLDNVDEFLGLSKFLWNCDRVFFCWKFCCPFFIRIWTACMIYIFVLLSTFHRQYDYIF